MNSRNLIIISITISNILFLFLYITLCINNRIAVDDFYFLTNVNDHGLINGSILEYNSWNSRWLSLLLNHSVLLIYQKTNITLILYGIFNLFSFVCVVFFLTSTISKHLTPNPTIQKGKNQQHYLSLFNYSFFLVSLIFISTMKIGETWFWLCSSTAYLWSNIMFLLGIACLLTKKTNTFLNLIGCFSFFFIGGSSPILALVSILLLAAIIILSISRHFPNQINKKIIQKRSFINILFCLTSFTVLYFGEGNGVREQFFQEVSISYSLILNFKMAGIIILKRIPLIIPFIAVLSLPITPYGNYVKNGTKDLNWKKKIILISIIYLGLIFLFQLPITYKTQDVGANRTLFFITILTLFFFLIIYFLFGKHSNLNNRFLNYITIIPFVISSFIFGHQLINQYSITSKYAEAHDQRMIYLKKHQSDQKIETLELKPLPPSGMLFSAEISNDTSHFSNKFLKKALGLSFNIKKQNTTK